jgi:hypothetical protein
LFCNLFLYQPYCAYVSARCLCELWNEELLCALHHMMSVSASSCLKTKILVTTPSSWLCDSLCTDVDPKREWSLWWAWLPGLQEARINDTMAPSHFWRQISNLAEGLQCCSLYWNRANCAFAFCAYPVPWTISRHWWSFHDTVLPLHRSHNCLVYTRQWTRSFGPYVRSFCQLCNRPFFCYSSVVPVHWTRGISAWFGVSCSTFFLQGNDTSVFLKVNPEDNAGAYNWYSNRGFKKVVRLPTFPPHFSPCKLS